MTATAVGDPPGSLANVTHTASVTTTVSCNATLPPPVCLTATPASSNKVTLKWSPYSGASSYKVKRSYVKGGPYTVIKTGLTTTNYTDMTVTNGAPYYYVVSAIKSAVETPNSNEDSAFPSAGGPAGWYTKDIGTVGDIGGSSFTAGKLWVGGSGADIWNTVDEFRYAYMSASGDCSIVARVTGIQNTDPWAKAGVMIRKTLADNAEHAAVFLTPGNGVAFQSRATVGGVSVNTNVTGPVAPYWVKLVRTGSVFTASYSANGSTWTTLGSTTISMTTGVYIGFAVTSHNDGIISVATFDNMTVTP
jgi:regulation of enolase protein 1 (concanavalin A-like superfamily)